MRQGDASALFTSRAATFDYSVTLTARDHRVHRRKGQPGLSEDQSALSW